MGAKLKRLVKKRGIYVAKDGEISYVEVHNVQTIYETLKWKNLNYSLKWKRSQKKRAFIFVSKLNGRINRINQRQ